jgi:hypothetical protein
MYLTPNDRAIYLYRGIMGAFLSSGEASTFDLDNHPWQELQAAKEWLCVHNPLFRHFATLPRRIQIGINESQGITLPTRMILTLL